MLQSFLTGFAAKKHTNTKIPKQKLKNSYYFSDTLGKMSNIALVGTLQICDNYSEYW